MSASPDPPLDLAAILDRLIRRYADILETQADDNFKIGDFLKMVEVRNKLQPDNTTQAAFWSHLDEIRHGQSTESATTRKPKPAKKPTGRKSTGSRRS